MQQNTKNSWDLINMKFDYGDYDTADTDKWVTLTTANVDEVCLEICEDTEVGITRTQVFFTKAQLYRLAAGLLVTAEKEEQ